MPGAGCPHCGSTKLMTDHGAGTVTCENCFHIVESGILVTEIGFTESAGGRVHVQGAFVGHGATGVSGHRGKTSNVGSETVKLQGRSRIDMVGRRMDIEQSIINGASKLFNMAVDNRFNKGRKTDYVVASCLYLQSRLRGGSQMLIDFSEELRINVFELGHTYIKLRTTLHLIEPMPMVDPALYCLRFASRLSFESEARDIAALASKLVRRFRTDWMTQGRRPAGVCGACIIIAARCHNFLRTPDEVGQVVKVSGRTICKRLREFAGTRMADLTVSQWKSLSDQQLGEGAEVEPPVVRQQRERQEREEAKVKVLQNQEEDELDHLDPTLDVEDPSLNGFAAALDEDEDEDALPAKRKRGRPRKPPATASSRARGKGKAKGPAPAVDQAMQEVAEEYGEDQSPDADTDAEDVDLEGMETGDFAGELTGARDNPEEAARENKRARMAFMRENRAAMADDTVLEAEEGVLQEMNTNEGQEKGDGEGWAAGRVENGDRDEEEDDDSDGENDGTTGRKARTKLPAFNDWDNVEAVFQYFEKHHFNDEAYMFRINGNILRERVKTWLHGRDPREVLRELMVVDEARRRRERQARAKPEVDFGDLDDEELEALYRVDEDEVNVRARLWLSHNGKWLEKEKERQEAKAEYARSRGLDPDKPRPKRRKRGQANAGGPGPGGAFASVREAIANVAEKKRFSTRVNYDALKGLLDGASDFGSPSGARLEKMSETYEDLKSDEGEDNDDEADGLEFGGPDDLLGLDLELDD